MATNRLSGLHVITDSVLRPDRSPLAIAEAAIAGGASVVQYREKSRSLRRMVEEAAGILRICRKAGVLLLVNDWLDVAMAIDADGIHLGQGDVACAVVRELLGDGKIIGISAATPEEARAAERDGADYVGVGPIYPTGSKEDAGSALGLDRIGAIRKACGLQIVAIGGIEQSNIAEIIASGADGAAVISAVVCAEDMAQAVRCLARPFR